MYSIPVVRDIWKCKQVFGFTNECFTFLGFKPHIQSSLFLRASLDDYVDFYWEPFPYIH